MNMKLNKILALVSGLAVFAACDINPNKDFE